MAFIGSMSFLALLPHQDSLDDGFEDHLTFEVTQRTRSAPHKEMIDIRIERPIEEADLDRIAREIKRKYGEGVDKIFIAYYLPDMRVGDGAWATTDWTPDLKIEVLGLEAKAHEEESTTDLESHDRLLLGRWADQRPGVASVASLVQQGHSVWLVERYRDGSESKTNVQLVGKRFYVERGVYLVINQDGDLEWHDGEGLFLTCRRLP